MFHVLRILYDCTLISYPCLCSSVTNFRCHTNFSKPKLLLFFLFSRCNCLMERTSRIGPLFSLLLSLFKDVSSHYILATSYVDKYI